MVRMGVNKIGGKKDHLYRSLAKKDAHRVARTRGTAKEVVRKEDVARTTFGRLKEGWNDSGMVPPKSAKILKKGEHEKIPGTRIQNGPGGAPVRIVIESGKAFPPQKAWACKQHMLKLAKERKEAEEIARMRGDELPAPSKEAAKILNEAGRRKERLAKRKKGEQQEPAEAPLSKKQRKMQQHEANQQKMEEKRKECLAGGERELLAESWHDAEVLGREKGFAWIKLSAASAKALGEEVMQKLSAANSTGEADAGADKLRLWFFDVAEQGLNLRPGAVVAVQLYKDKKGAGACNAKSAAASPAAAPNPAAEKQPEVPSGTSAAQAEAAALDEKAAAALGAPATQVDEAAGVEKSTAAPAGAATSDAQDVPSGEPATTGEKPTDA